MRSELKFNKLRLLVRLGWGDEERRIPQPVDVSFTLSFKTPPRACATDQLGETICYSRLSDVIRATAETKSYNLIESLGARIHESLRVACSAAGSKDCRIQVEVTKVNPPIAGLGGGVTFVYGDQPW